MHVFVGSFRRRTSVEVHTSSGLRSPLWLLSLLFVALCAVSASTPARLAPLVELPGKPIKDASYLPFQGGVVFEGEDEAAGVELWWTDGSPGGTRRLTDVQPGVLNGLCPDVDGADPLIVDGDVLYFFGRTGDKIDLWRLRWGESAELVRQLGVPCQQFDPFELDVVVRTDTDHLFVLVPSLREGSSTTEPAVWRIHLPSGNVEVVAFAPSGWEIGGIDSLWNDEVYVRLRSQGPDTAAYARLDEDIEGIEIIFTNDWYPHASGSYQGRRILGGQQLYISDGTAAGTSPLTSQGLMLAGPGFEWNGIYYLVAARQTIEDELWRTDGTPQGSYVVRNFNGNQQGVVGQPVLFDDRIVFFRWDNGITGTSVLFESDGTEGGTFEHEFDVPQASLRLAQILDTTKLLPVGDYLYLLAANRPSKGTAALWRIEAVTRRAEQVSEATEDSSNVTDLAHVNGKFLIRSEPNGVSQMLGTGDVFSDGFEPPAGAR